MMDDGEIVEDNGPPQPSQQPVPTPAASRRPIRRTSAVRTRPPTQYPNSRQGQYGPQYQGQNAPQYQSQYAPQYQGRGTPQYYE